jgi:Transglutaminase-like superfamily
MSDLLAYYTAHSRFTDPGRHSAMLDNLPSDLAALHEIIQGLLIHIWKVEAAGGERSIERRRQYETRSVARMLALIHDIDAAPLTSPRPEAQRLIIDCRHFATLLCGILRQKDIPARVRCGFATYLEPDPQVFQDHFVCEYWNAAEKRWMLEDADLQRHDVPRDQFVVAGHAWQQVRAGELDPARFHWTRELCGSWVVAGDTVRDLAALNRCEPLSSDGWGLALHGDTPLTADDLALLDRVAAHADAADEHAVAELYALYQREPALRMPDVVTAWSYADKAMRAVDLSATDTI